METTVVKIPKLEELIAEENWEQNALIVILNNQPPQKWVKDHPTVKIKLADNTYAPLKYIPRERIEYMLTRIFKKWWVEVKDVKLIANSVCVTVRLFVVNPLDGSEMYNDGVGAAPLQTDKGAGAIEFNQLKAAAVQMSAPAAETYAFKDAAEKFGKLFGRDLNVMDIDYTSLYKERPEKIELTKEQIEEERMKALIANCETLEMLEKLQQDNPDTPFEWFSAQKDKLTGQTSLFDNDSKL